MKVLIFYTEANLSAGERIFFFSCIIAAGMAVGILFYDSLIISGVIAAILIVAMPGYKEGCIRKHQQTLLMQFKDLLYSVSASVSSGRNMAGALAEAKEFCGTSYEESDYIMIELEHMTAMLENGNETDTEVLYDFARRSGLEDVQDFARVYENCKTSGANLNNAITTAVKLIGDKIELEDELKSQLSQKLFEGRIVGISPFVMVLMIKLTAPDYIRPMTETTEGLIITTISLGLMAASILMTERINKIEI